MIGQLHIVAHLARNLVYYVHEEGESAVPDRKRQDLRTHEGAAA